jgi:prepilin-type N-terminal cleavage/methylation domain-containing protein
MNIFTFSRTNHEKGFTIIELMVTIIMLSVGIIGAYSAFSPFVSLTYNISNRFEAAYLGQEGLEIVRNMRDNNVIRSTNNHMANWSDGLLECDLGCQLDYKTGTLAQTFANKLKPYDPSEFLKINADNAYSYDDGTNTRFQRKVTITQESGPDILKVSVLVTWDYNGSPFNFETVEYLYNWH